ncbi:MAG: hydrogenase iron-sulfur subunit [Candidatus Cloacimonetes bacterium]|nr:hydrogenase iron-sulfur subunit [Candidatus Cloacimonadota bacterium]
MNPKAVIFCCNWSSFPGLQLSAVADEEPSSEQKVIVNMCSGRISSELLLEAFKNNAWGVLIAACPEDKCEHDANYKTHRRILLLRKTLEQFGIEPERIKLEWIDKTESAKLKKSIDVFMKEIKELGPINTLN